MITVRRGNGRHCERHRKGEVWLTFHPQDQADPLSDGFGTLELLNEKRLPPGADVPPRSTHDAEIVTYVHEGALAYEDPTGRWSVIQAGEFQHMSGGQGRSERNASKTEWAHIFRIYLRPSEAGVEAVCEQKRFTAAERRGRLCAVVSPDAHGKSLHIHQNAFMYSAMLDPGQHVVHELSLERSAWLHVVEGKVRLGDFVLGMGDGAGITAQAAVSLTALEETSILLLDVGEVRAPGLPVQAAARGAGELSGAALFAKFWNALVDILGPAATAAIVSQSARNAILQIPALAEIAVTRSDGKYSYELPRSYEGAIDAHHPINAFLDEIRVPLVQLTGQVVFRHLQRIPELREWATLSTESLQAG